MATADSPLTDVRLEQVLLLPLDTLPGHAPDSPLMREYADRLTWFYPPADADAERHWLRRGRGVTFAETVELAARLLGPAEPVDLAVTVTATPDSGEAGYPGCLLRPLLPGAPAVLGITGQGAAGPFTALRIAAERIASGEARRAVVLVMEQCRLPDEDGLVLPARDRAVLLVLGAEGSHALGASLVSRTPPADAATITGPAPGEGITGPWADLAERWAGLAGASVAVTAHDAALSYWCRLELDAVPDAFDSSGLELALWAEDGVGA